MIVEYERARSVVAKHIVHTLIMNFIEDSAGQELEIGDQDWLDICTKLSKIANSHAQPLYEKAHALLTGEDD